MLEVVVFEVLVFELALLPAGLCGCIPGFWLAWLQPQILDEHVELEFWMGTAGVIQVVVFQAAVFQVVVFEVVSSARNTSRF